MYNDNTEEEELFEDARIRAKREQEKQEAIERREKKLRNLPSKFERISGAYYLDNGRIRFEERNYVFKVTKRSTNGPVFEYKLHYCETQDKKCKVMIRFYSYPYPTFYISTHRTHICQLDEHLLELDFELPIFPPPLTNPFDPNAFRDLPPPDFRPLPPPLTNSQDPSILKKRKFNEMNEHPRLPGVDKILGIFPSFGPVEGDDKKSPLFFEISEEHIFGRLLRLRPIDQLHVSFTGSQRVPVPLKVLRFVCRASDEIVLEKLKREDEKFFGEVTKNHSGTISLCVQVLCPPWDREESVDIDMVIGQGDSIIRFETKVKGYHYCNDNTTKKAETEPLETEDDITIFEMIPMLDLPEHDLDRPLEEVFPPDFVDYFRTPIASYYAFRNDKEKVRECVEKDPNVGTKESVFGVTPIMVAERFGRDEILGLLKQKPIRYRICEKVECSGCEEEDGEVKVVYVYDEETGLEDVLLIHDCKSLSKEIKLERKSILDFRKFVIQDGREEKDPRRLKFEEQERRKKILELFDPKKQNRVVKVKVGEDPKPINIEFSRIVVADKKIISFVQNV